MDINNNIDINKIDINKIDINETDLTKIDTFNMNENERAILRMKLNEKELNDMELNNMEINKIFDNIYMFKKHLKPIKYIDQNFTTDDDVNITTDDDVNIIKGSVNNVYNDEFEEVLDDITNLDEKLKYDKYYILFRKCNYLSHYFVVLIKDLENKTIKDLLIEIKNEWYKLADMLNPVYDTHDKDEEDVLSNFSMYDFTIIGYIDGYPLIKFDTDS